MKDTVTSEVTHITYAVKDVVRIVNYQQAIYYINSGIPLLDIYTSIDRRSDKPIFVYIFNRADTATAYDAWCNRVAREVYEF